MDIKKLCDMKSRHRLFFSVVLVILLLSLTWALIPIVFETSDDSFMMSCLSGGKTGKPEVDTIFSQFFWGKMISSLYVLNAGVPWYTLAFSILTALSLITVCYCVVSSFPRWGGSLFCLLYFCMFLYYTAVLQFTVVSSFCGVAALSLMLTDQKEEKRRSFIVRNSIIFFFIFFAVNIRPKVGYLALGSAMFAVCLAIAGYLLKIVDRKKLQKTIVSFLVFCVATGICVCVHEIHESRNGWKNFREYHVERARFTDYTKLDYMSNKDLFDKIEWSEEFYDLVKNWFFMDETVNAETFRAVNERNAPVAMGVKEAIFRTFPRISFQVKVWVILLLFLAVDAIIRRQKIIVEDGVPFLWMILWLAETWYFAHSGRMMERAFEAWTLLAVVPSVLGMGVSRNRQENTERVKSRAGDLVIPVALLLCCVLCVWYPHGGYCGAKELSLVKAKAAAANGDLEDYVIANSENIYIFGTSVSREGEPWRVYTEGSPYNLIFWGGSSCNSPIYDAQLKKNGLEHIYMKDFFLDNVYFIAHEEPDQSLCNVMEEKFPGCTYKITDMQHGFIVYKFFE